MSWLNRFCCTFSDRRSTFDLNPRRIAALADVFDTVFESEETNNSSFTDPFEL